MKSKGRLIVISGPAGCGKDSIIEGLFERCDDFEHGLFYSVSVTTRAPREGEKDGVHYHFKTREEFEKLIREDAFLEYTEYCGNYYGTLKKTIVDALEAGKNMMLKIEIEGAARIISMFIDCCLPVFILPPSMEELRRRLHNRSTEDEATIDKRVKRAVFEMLEADNYAYQVINDDLQTAIDEVAEIIIHNERSNG